MRRRALTPRPALSVRGLTKTYRGGFTAIEGLDLDIPDGAFFGLLGPNGAGKTTLIGAVCNLLRPTAGEIRVFGHHHESREARRADHRSRQPGGSPPPVRRR